MFESNSLSKVRNSSESSVSLPLELLVETRTQQEENAGELDGALEVAVAWCCLWTGRSCGGVELFELGVTLQLPVSCAADGDNTMRAICDVAVFLLRRRRGTNTGPGLVLMVNLRRHRTRRRTMALCECVCVQLDLMLGRTRRLGRELWA